MICGETVGKENRKALVECILRGLYVSGTKPSPHRVQKTWWNFLKV